MISSLNDGAGNRQVFKEVMTFELSLENFRIRKFRDEITLQARK